MSDRILVLSKRPAVVKNSYTIEMENKGLPSINRKNKKFDYYYDLIWKDFDYHEI